MLGVGTSETIVVVLIILIISIIVRKLARAGGWRMVVFVSDKVRVHFMRKEKDQRRE